MRSSPRDGRGLKRLTPWSLDAGDNPDWSPNGRLILFRLTRAALSSLRSTSCGRTEAVCGRSRAQGGDDRPLVFFTRREVITFARSGRGGEPDIFVMSERNGPTGHAHRVWDSAPDWGAVSQSQ